MGREKREGERAEGGGCGLEMREIGVQEDECGGAGGVRKNWGTRGVGWGLQGRSNGARDGVIAVRGVETFNAGHGYGSNGRVRTGKQRARGKKVKRH